METSRQIFEAHGLRCTRQREQIYEALAASKVHPTAEELFSNVRALEPGLSLATVYNTLEAFTACGIARRIRSAPGPCRYDADTSAHVHITTPDGRIVDLPEDLSRRLLGCVPAEVLAEVERRTGIRVSGVSVHLSGESGPGPCRG
jgi:Fe2+ or Zn2+ uptake regulation protein